MHKITEKYKALLTFNTYEEYLDNFRTKDDLMYINNNELTYIIAEMGLRTGGKVLSKKEFYAIQQTLRKSQIPPKITSFFFDEKRSFTNPILRELAIRQLANYQKIVSTIIFVYYRERSGVDLTGYIDFEHSLRKAHANMEGCLDWKGIFAGKKKIIPNQSDLSFHNWKTGVTSYNNSSNYETIFQQPGGVYFKYKADRKLIRTKPWAEGDCVWRDFFFFNNDYYIATYDYFMRKKI